MSCNMKLYVVLHVYNIYVCRARKKNNIVTFFFTTYNIHYSQTQTTVLPQRTFHYQVLLRYDQFVGDMQLL